MNNQPMTHRDLFVKIVAKDGAASFDHRRVWDDGSRLLQSLREEYAKVGKTVHDITRSEYDAHRFAKREASPNTTKEAS